MFNLKIQEAIKFFETHESVDPRFKNMGFVGQIWIAYATGDKKSHAKILKNMGKTIKDLEKISHFTSSVTDVFKKKVTAKDMESDQACVSIAFLSLLSASLEFSERSFVKAGISMRRSWKFYEECYKMLQDYGPGMDTLDPVYVNDVKFGYGIFQFAISLFPPNLLFLIETLGFKADRMVGWQIIHEVSNVKSFSGLVAKLMLIMSYQLWLQDPPNSLKLYDQAQKTFTDLAMSKYLASIVYRFQGQIDESIEGFTYLIKAAEEQVLPFSLQCHYELGSTYVKLSAYEKAIPHFEKFQNENTGEAFQCLCGFELGVAYVLTRDYEKAKTSFKFAIKQHRDDIPWEIYYARKAKEFLNSGIPELMNPWEICYFEARERWKTSKWKDCMEILDKGKEAGLITNSGQKGCYNLTIGHCYKKLGQFDQAKEHLTLAYQEKSSTESWVTPHAYAEVGTILLEDKNTAAEGVKLLQKAKSFDNYDFRNILLRDIELQLDKSNGIKYCLI